MMDGRPFGLTIAFGILLSLGPVSVLAETASLSSHEPSTLSRSQFCKSMTDHHAVADATYKPGVDVHGKAVAPADVPSSTSFALPNKIAIPLTLDLAKSLNLNVSQYPYNRLGTGTEVQLGTLTLEGDQVFFNGKPLTSQDQEGLLTACSTISQHP